MYIELERKIKNIRELKGSVNLVLYDMCCGIGVYSILFHKYFNECICIDKNPNNIKIGIEIKSMNNIDNINYFEGRIEEIMEEKLKEDSREKIIIFNPGRSGLRSSVLNLIKKRKNESLIFILCDPKPIISLQQIFNSLNYSFKVEMFPKTNNLEYIVEVI